MKIEKLLHTPDGVRDVYGDESALYRELEDRLRKVFLSYGYSDIRTPSFEYFDVFSEERGSVPSRDLYKFFDHDGNTLVLRPDITPAIARCAAKYYDDILFPVRLSYIMDTFINHSGYQGRLKERTQAGAECFGYGDVDADAEMIALLIRALRNCGLTEFKIELGQVDFFRGLVEEAGIDDDTAEELRSLISGKNFYGLEDRARKLGLPEDITAGFVGISELFGDVSCLEKAPGITSNPVALAAVDYLKRLFSLLSAYGMERFLTFDLGMLGNYTYYTGVVFRAFSYGSGEPIAAGGRYDRLMRQFGKDVPAIGFGMMLDTVVSALKAQEIGITPARCETLLVFEDDADHTSNVTAITYARQMRNAGENVQLLKKTRPMEDCLAYAKSAGFTRVLYACGSEVTEAEL